MQHLNNRYGEIISDFYGGIRANHTLHSNYLSTGESLVFLVVIQVWQTTIKRRMPKEY